MAGDVSLQDDRSLFGYARVYLSALGTSLKIYVVPIYLILSRRVIARSDAMVCLPIDSVVLAAGTSLLLMFWGHSEDEPNIAVPRQVVPKSRAALSSPSSRRLACR